MLELIKRQQYKKAINQLGFRASKDIYERANEILLNQLKEAAQRTGDNKRTTIMAKDL